MPTHLGKKRNECYEKIIAGRCWTVLVKKIKKDCLIKHINQLHQRKREQFKKLLDERTEVLCAYTLCCSGISWPLDRE